MPSARLTGRFSRADRLLDSRDFRRVLRHGRRRTHSAVVVVSVRRKENTNESKRLKEIERVGSRLGITASRKFGNAIVRNRFKRRVREWFRHNHQEIAEPLDIVVIARRGAASWTTHDLHRCLSASVRPAPLPTPPTPTPTGRS